MRGVPRERCAIRCAPADIDRQPKDARGARDDALDVLDRVELEPLHDAEPVAQRRSQKPGTRRRADQRERRQVELDRARGRALADHDVELKVLHRRIEDFLDDRAQTMDLIDEQHVARLQIGQQCREIAGALQHGTGGLPQIDAQLVRDDVRQRRLAEARRPENQHVIQRFAAVARRSDEDLHLRLDGALPDVVGQHPRPDRAFYRFVFAGALRPNDAFFAQASPSPRACSARRIRSSVEPSPPSAALSRRATSAGL